MFEGQPKGLYALALANTGERFGYYTMLAIFTLFLQAKFGYTAAETSTIFGCFLAAVYFIPFFGGILADKFGYGKMVTMGIVVMFIGYALLAIPTSDNSGKIMMFGALALIACGTGLFKGNLQVMVGNLYDAPEYSSKRDTAFSIFYMAINIGAMYAPTAATKVTNYMLGKAGLSYVPLRFLHWHINISMEQSRLPTRLLSNPCRLHKTLPVTLPLSVLLISISSPKLTTMDLVWHVCP